MQARTVLRAAIIAAALIGSTFLIVFGEPEWVYPYIAVCIIALIFANRLPLNPDSYVRTVWIQSLALAAIGTAMLVLGVLEEFGIKLVEWRFDSGIPFIVGGIAGLYGAQKAVRAVSGSGAS